MSDVIIVGGGPTGLAAAWELERLAVPYTLIELKSRLGGEIHSERVQGFVLDAGPLTYEKRGEWAFLRELGLENQLVAVSETGGLEHVLFKDGTEVLTRALSARITHPLMLRMAVSSVGFLDERTYGVCLENGVLVSARAVIIAAPAAYAEHMLRSLQPEAAYRLLDYRYDSTARVLLGYPRDDIPALPSSPPADYPITSFQSVDHPSRVPQGHLLIQAAVRLRVVDDLPDDLPLQLAAAMRWPLNPVVARAYYWPHAFPLTRHALEHAENMAALERLLPERVAVVGSDYRAYTLDQQVEQGRAAAARIAAALQRQ